MSEARNDWRALCYALYLRNRRDPPLSTDEIAYLVAERYPHTADRLKPLIDGSQGEKRDQFGRLVGHVVGEKAKAAGA